MVDPTSFNLAIWEVEKYWCYGNDMTNDIELPAHNNWYLGNFKDLDLICNLLKIPIARSNLMFKRKPPTFMRLLSSFFIGSISSLISPEFTFSSGTQTSRLPPSRSPSKLTLALPMLSSPNVSAL
jgi:hypothetical protein